MENQNKTIDFSKIPSKNPILIEPINDSKDTASPHRNKIYFAIITISFVLTFTFYYTFFKNEQQRVKPKIVPFTIQAIGPAQ